MGISTYRITRQFPKPLRHQILPIKDLQGVVEKLRGDPRGERI
jgi:hypothetical protein